MFIGVTMKVNKSRYQEDLESRQVQMRQRILKAAMELFLKQGFDSVTIRKLAAKIGYSVGTLYRYFPDKDEIFFALRGEGFEKFYQIQMQARKSSNPETRLRQHAWAYVEFALENPEYYELMFMMKAPIERAAEKKEWAAPARSLDLLRDDVKRAVSGGLLHTDSIDSAVYTIWFLLHGTVSLLLRKRLLLHSSATSAELANMVTTFMLNNLLHKKGANNEC
jgi:AcrR family transcriptional regulator